MNQSTENSNASELLKQPTRYWNQIWPKPGLPPGEELSALRRGIGRTPGDVPQMWAFYTELKRGGDLTVALRAEHAALALFGFHQQSQTVLMHMAGVRLGEALAKLRASDRFSEKAVDRRLAACATSNAVEEFAYHLRGLVSMLKSISQGFDYDELFENLRAWQYPDGIARVRRRLGGDYFATNAKLAEPKGN